MQFSICLFIKWINFQCLCVQVICLLIPPLSKCIIPFLLCIFQVFYFLSKMWYMLNVKKEKPMFQFSSKQSMRLKNVHGLLCILLCLFRSQDQPWTVAGMSCMPFQCDPKMKSMFLLFKEFWKSIQKISMGSGWACLNEWICSNEWFCWNKWTVRHAIMTIHILHGQKNF